ncbi:LLM class F420-dependent oxidoreductase [Rhodococcus sp. NPDC058505]|uniref:LLM class F420-dependent oxidoreductase n=1 Tax=unclassified Rhodococcus (in: high G+C Gram-positive bacteria) TaxID=192944 RepID=UPI00365CB49F
MRIGIVTPVLIQHPATRADWEVGAGIDDVATIAAAADRLGYHHVTCSEHVAVPTDIAADRGGTYWDPLATFGYLAATTTRIRLLTQVLVLGYHHPLEIAKRYGTLDRISGGRLTLGLGVGSLREEFDLLGAEFTGRGARADDALRALRAALGRATPEYHGEFYDFADLVVEPHATQDRVPLWIGGRTPRSLRRAIELGDGWVPFGLRLDDLTTMLAKAPVPEGMEIALAAGRALDPTGNAEGAIRALTRLRDAGATVAGVTLDASGVDHYCDQLAALAELAVPLGIEFD